MAGFAEADMWFCQPNGDSATRLVPIFNGAAGRADDGAPARRLPPLRGGSRARLHGGKVVSGTWRKGAFAEKFAFTLDDGSPLAVAPGRTWVELPHVRSELTIS